MRAFLRMVLAPAPGIDVPADWPLTDDGGFVPPQRHGRGGDGRGRRRLVALLAAALVAGAGASAWAYWTVNATSGSAGAAAATSVNRGSTPTATANPDHSITVNWGPTTLANGAPVDGYVVKRYDAQSPYALQTTLSDCSGVVAALTCTEDAVPPGKWRYAITPVRGDHWRGTESDKSGVVVSAAVLTLDKTVYGSGDFAGGDATVAGSLTGFQANEGISYRLDASTSLTGTPSSADASGDATVSITLPLPSDGTHTIYALGDATPTASEASAAILVDTTAPTVTALLSPGANAAGWNNSSPVAVTLTADDGADSSGVAEVEYTTDGTDPKTSGTAHVYSAPFDVASTTTVKFFATDVAGNASTVQTQDVKIDTVAPTNDVSLDVTSGNALLDGSTLWYRGVAAGSFMLSNALTDGGSGPASTGYAALSGTSTGWSFTSSSVTSGPPYVSNAFSWDAGTTSSPGEAVTGHDVADNFTTTNLTLTNDSTGPTDGFVDATGLVGTGSRYSTSTTLSIALSKGTDSGVGVSTSGAELLRASAPLFSLDGQTDGTCGAYSAYAPLLTDPASPYADNAAGGIAPGNCYSYEYLVSDKLGNQTSYTSGDIKVETAPPASLTPTIALSSATGSTYVSGATVYTNPQPGRSGSFVASATASDDTSGMMKVNFPVLTGFVSGGGDDTSSPFQTTYGWSGAATTSSGSQTVTATDNAALTATSAFTVTPDTTTPTISASAKTADNSTYIAGTWTNQTVTVRYTCSDAGSGVASCPADQTFSAEGVTASTSGTATDNVGNQASASFGPIKVDKTNPTITASAKNADNSTYTAGTWTNQTVTVHFTCSDGSSGVASCPADQIFSAEGVTPSTSGTATDNAGNSASASFGPIEIDKTKPATTLTTSPASPDGTNSWFKRSSVSFTLLGSDGASGVATSFYTIDSGATQTYSGAVMISTQGDHTVTFWSVDNAGNVESTNTTHIKIDNIAPVTTIATTPASANGSNGWFVSPNSSVSFALGATDATSGVASRFYTIDGGATQTYSSSVTVNTNGDHTILYWSTDSAGNVESQNVFHIKIDTAAPTTTLTTSPASPDGTNSWFKQSSVSFTLSATDATSGVGSRFYTIDGGATQTYSGAVTINTPGDHTVTYWSVDTAGNVETTNTAHIKLDIVAPVTTIATSPSSPNGSNSWFVSPNSSVSFTLSATDATSGIASRFYTLDGGATQTYSSAVTVSTNGDHTILYWSTDNAGNVESQNVFHIKIDTAAPTTTLTTGPASPDGTNSWFKQSSVSFTLSATDATSGVGSRFYTIDGGKTLTYSGAVTISTQGDHTVTFWSVDNAGNVESTHTTHIKLDNIAPVTAIATSPSSANGSNGWFVTPNSSVSFTLSATDATSGLASRFYTLDGGATQTYSTSVTVSGDGDHVILYWSTDSAGNVESQNIFHIKIDTVTPATVLALTSQTAIAGPASTTNADSALVGTTLYYNGNDGGGSFKIQNAVTDATSGAASSTFGALSITTNWTHTTPDVQNTPSGGPYASNLFAWADKTSNSPTEAVTATDSAGNTNTATTLTFTNDTTNPGSPTVTFPVNNADYTTTAWTGSITGTASDSGSGIGKVQVSVQATSGTNINMYFDPSSGGFTSPTEKVLTASGTTSWSLSFPASNFTDTNAFYKVSVYAIDRVGNFPAAVTKAFDIDNVAPAPAVTFPVNGTTYDATSWAAGASSKITGTSSDAVSGVASDQVAVQQVSSGNYWNGTSFSSTTQQFFAASGTTSWTLSFAATNFPSDGAYTVYARSTDVAGNTSSPVTSTFNYDNTNPTATMTFPAASGVYNATSWNAGCASAAGICGTASDPSGGTYVSGLANITVSIKDVTAAKFWNGTSFGAGSETFFAASGTATWSLAFDASKLVSGHTFQVHARATDNAGNTFDVTNGSIVYDNAAPTVSPVAIQKSSGGSTSGFVPQGGTYFVYTNVSDTGGSNISTVTASASSITTGASSVSLSTTGGPWTIGAQSYNYRSAQLTADNPKPEGAYSFSVTATDGAANQTTNTSGSVTIDNTKPTSTVTFPANSGNYNTAGWTGSITGAASDASAGVASVAVTVQQQSTGNYWNGTAFNSSSPVSLAATVTTSWSLAFSAANFTTDGTYVVTSTATDNAGNAQSPATTSTFVIDKTLPTASLTFPAGGGNYNTAGWNGSLTGTATDATSGVTTVQYAVQQGTGNYWNGTSFSSASQLFFTATGTNSWSATFPMPDFPADGSYTVYAKSTDAAGNVSTVVSNIFKVDNVKPTSSVTFPANNANYNTASWTGSISGTASDATAGVASVALTIQQVGTGNYWNGSAFASGTPVSLAATGTTSWSLSFAGANFTTDGTYVVTATATDGAGNVQSPIATNTFVVDKTNPTTSISFPANNGNYNTAGWGGSISGTSSDATSGVSTVQYAVQQGTGNYWNGTTFGSATAVFFTASGTTSWSATFPASNFTVDGSYTVYAKSTDAANNVNTTVSNTFKVDKTNPTAAVTFPAAGGNYNAAGWTGFLTGTASDATSGLASVQVAVQQGGGNYWDPGTSSFSSSAQLFFAPTGTGSWSYAFPSSNFPTDGSYTVFAKSTDAAGNTSSVASNTFKFDTTAPTSAIGFPANNGNYNTAGWSGTISGSASDATSGVASVSVTVRQQSSGNYWNGTGFSSPSAVLLSASGTTSWSLTFAAANFTTDGTYVVTSTATDSAGNVQSPVTSSTFVVDKTIPTASLTFPANSGNYTNSTWLGSLTGTATDTTSGVAKVEYAVQQGSGNYWNGTGFASASQFFIQASGTSSWSATFAASNFPADGQYTVYARSTDAAGNVSTIVSNTFKIDNVAPTSSITFPANSGNYNTAGWTGSISGSASDATSGVASVSVTIKQQSSNLYWNGSAFNSATPVQLTPTGTTSWSLTFAAANFTTDGTYVVASTATDNAGLVQSPAALNTFVFDKTSPTAAVAFPAASGNYNTAGWAGSISGTASDATAGLSKVEYAVQQGTGNYWNGTSFGSATATFFTATGTTSWSATFPASNFSVDGTYTVYAKSTDAAGNVSTTVSNTFKVDKTIPTAAITFPANSGNYSTSGWSGSLTGTASDATSGVAGVQLALQQGSGNYWDPNTSSFSSSTQLFFSATGTTNWSSTFAASNFPADGSYTLYAKSTDAAANVSSVASNTFKYDASAPASTVSFPASGGNYNTAGWTGSITGTASDTTSGVASVAVTIQQQSSSLYWNGTAFNSASPVSFTATGTAGWSLSFPATNFATDGSYVVRSTATDVAGNVQPSATTSTFVVDKTIPTASLTFPANSGNYTNSTWLGSLTGTATDTTSGVAKVEYAVQQGSGNYWNGTAFSSASQFFIQASGTSSWSATFAASNFPADGQYTVYARSTDAAGNVSTTVSNIFKVDNVKPTSSITFPANSGNYNTAGWTGSITGSASDATSGVASVALTVQQQSSGNYWNGSAFSSATPVSLAATGTTSWSLSFAASNFSADGTYVVTATATDNAGLVQSPTASSTFVVDKTNPTASIAFPANNGNYNTAGWSGSLSGSASDATSGVTTVQVAVQQGPGNYWNPATTSFSSATAVFFNASGTTSWSATFPASNFTADGSYTVYAKSTDAASNVSATVSNTFKIDKTIPTAAITFPAASGNYSTAGWGGSLTGTASDATSGVATVQLAVQQGGGNYWNPATGAFDLSSQTFFAASGTGSWSSSFPASNFPADGSYTLYAKSIDAAGNASTVASNTFKYDTVAPASTITFPATSGNYNTAGWTGSITGAASDATSGVASVAVTIQQQSSSLYWNGTGFSSSSPVSLAATGTTSWSLTFAAANFVSDGTYVVRSTATDVAGNVQSSSSTSTFVIDKASPTASITFPNGGNYTSSTWSGALTGTATDTTSGVASVQYAVQQGSGNYWNPATGHFDLGTQTFVTATGTNSWSQTFPASNFPADGSYTVYAKSTDAANNVSTTASNTFKIDNVAPTSAITFPANSGNYNTAGWGGSITGSASDATSGVASVAVTVRQSSTGNYWDGSGFASVAPVSLATSGTTSWSLSFAAANFTTDGTYVVTSTATDNVGIVQSTAASNTFVVDNTNPTTAISFPADGGDYNATGWGGGSISGTASDATSGLSNVKVTIKQQSTNLYWGGSSFNSATPVLLSATGTASWSLTFAAANFTTDGTYLVNATSTDNAGNTNTVTNTFKVDKTAPTAAVTFPASNGNYNAAGWTGAINGTATDVTSDVSGVVLAVQQGSGNYWNPATGQFDLAAQTYFAATGTSSWTYTFPASNFPADGSYTVYAKSTDVAGNTSSVASNSFKYDTTAPTAAITFPAASANYNATGWTDSITGTASDATTLVANVKVTIQQQSSGNYWSGSAFTSATPVLFTATGTSSWSLAFPDTNFPANGAYTVTATATDSAGNASAVASRTFNYDTTPPTNSLSLVNQGTDGGLATSYFSGNTIFYKGNAAGGRTFQIQNAVGDTLSGPASSTFAALGGTSTGWTHTTPDVQTTPSAGPYVSNTFTWLSTATTSPTEVVTGADAAGNTAAAPTLTFTNDITAPTATITFPSTASYNNSGWNGTITGTAGESGSGFAAIKVSVKDTTAGSCADATGAFIVAGCTTNFVSATGTTSWSFAESTANLTDGHSYTVTVETIDNVGNVNAGAASASWTYDTTAPNAVIAFPAASGAYNATGWTDSITGTASDATSGVANVKLTIQQQSSGNYWSGSAFNSAASVLITATGTTSWSLAFANTNFPANGTYIVTATATDSAGNAQTATSRTFVYDTTPPTNSLSLVSQGTTGAGNPTSFLSGTKIFYNGSAATGRTFQIQNAVADANSGPASSTFAALGGTSTGWAHVTPDVQTTPGGGPYVSNTFTWNSGTTSAPTEVVTGSDAAGNTTAAGTLTLTNDIAAATTTATLSPTASGLGWTTADTTVNLSATDGTASGVASITYSAMGAQTIASTTISGSSAAPVITTEGTTTISYFSTDNVGNVETTKTVTVKLDKSTPDAPSMSTVPSFIKNSQALTVTSATDNGPSGVASVSYLYCAGTSCTPNTSIGSSSTGTSYSVPWSSQPANGTYTIAAKTTDVAGNVSALSATQTVTIDNTVPAATTNITLGGNSNGLADLGDTVSIVFSEKIKSSSFCSTWNDDTNASTLSADNDVTVTITQSGSQDLVSVSSGSCTFHFGSLNLKKDYVTATSTFFGAGTNASKITWNPSTLTLTITLGLKQTGTLGSAQTAGAPVYTPDAGLTDLAGNGISTTAVTAGSSTKF